MHLQFILEHVEHILNRLSAIKSTTVFKGIQNHAHKPLTPNEVPHVKNIFMVFIMFNILQHLITKTQQ